MSIRLLRWCALLCFAALLLVANRTTEKVTPRELHRPTATPDRIILTWAGDPSTTQAVTWRTSNTVERAVAQIAVASEGPEFVKQARTAEARSEAMKTDLNEARSYSVEFTGLQPGTAYVYRVGDGENWSEWNQFRTAAAGTAPLEFIYVGDAQNDIYSLWSRLIRQGLRDAPRMQFIVHAGDLVTTSTSDELWGEWHQAAGWINRSVASFPTPGNHEYPQTDGQRVLAPLYRPQFTLPGNGVAGLEETNYYVDIQGVRMISLNSNERQEEQAAWLDKLLGAGHTNRWVVLTFHHPIYSSAKGRDNPKLREMWQPLFDKHKVDLVLTGHDHTYARTNLVGSTVYVVSVSGPKMYVLERNPRMMRAAANTQLFQIVRIDGGTLQYEARTATGALYDAFELRKANKRGSTNKLTNRVPSMPERLDPPPGR
ncbi:MAG: metallophosphoesterase family protein [Acidobacteria bacterium]|nr:metallophosphoesterase family protein [Acidobacteriota bacterium]